MFTRNAILSNAGLVAIQEALACMVGSVRKIFAKQHKYDYCPRSSPSPSRDASADRPSSGSSYLSSRVVGSSKQGASGRARSGSSGSSSGSSSSSEQSEPSDGNIDEVSATFATLNAALRRQAQLVRAFFPPSDARAFVELLLARVYEETCAHLTRCRQTPLSSMVSTSSSGSSGGAAKGGGGGNSGSDGGGGSSSSGSGSNYRSSGSSAYGGHPGISPLGGLKLSRDLNELHNVAKDLLLLASPATTEQPRQVQPLGAREVEREEDQKTNGSARGGTAISAAFSSSSGGSSNVAGSSSVEQHNAGGMAQGLAAAFEALRQMSTLFIASPEQLPDIVQGLCAENLIDSGGVAGPSVVATSEYSRSTNSSHPDRGGSNTPLHIDGGMDDFFVIPHAKRQFVHDLLRCRSDFFKDTYGRRAKWVKEQFPDLCLSAASSASLPSLPSSSSSSTSTSGQEKLASGREVNAALAASEDTTLRAASSSRFSMFSRR